MKAESIAVRIADFLKDHAPFSFLNMDDLTDLAASGKVKFHEDGEYIFTEGHPRDQFMYVIQQGRVKILESNGNEERLVDLRGRGDLLGLQGVFSEEPYIHTGLTEMETILYALPRDKFARLINKSPEARRYLAAYFSLNPAYHWEETRHGAVQIRPNTPVTLRKGGLFEVEPPQAIARWHLNTASPDTPIQELARRLRSRLIDCVIIVDENGYPIGKITDADLRDNLAQGKPSQGAIASDWMRKDIATAAPMDCTGDLLLKLTLRGKNFLAVTENGQSNSRVLGLVSERNLFLQYGRFPTVVGQAIASAPDIPALRLLRDRIEALILEFIEDRAALSWLMEMTGVLNRSLSLRLIELAAADMASEGIEDPGLSYSWLMMGSGGRDELLIRSAVYHALVYEDPQPEQEAVAGQYFSELTKRASSGLRQCGFLESVQGVLAQNAQWCLPISKMCERFRDYIARPAETHVYSARDAFDFHPLTENCALAAKLSTCIREAIHQHPQFIRHMASDSLLNQPPRTIFQGYVVDNKGIQRDSLAIKFHALLPLVDVGRVFTLLHEDLDTMVTWKRLKKTGELLENEDPRAAQLFFEASEAFQVALFARISRGLAAGTDGAVIRPADLDPETRALLVTSFRATLNILEFTAARFGMQLRS